MFARASLIAWLFVLPLQAEVAQKPLGKFFGAKIVEIPDWFKSSFLDLGEDLTEADQADKHLMIYFHQDGCPYCAKLVEENFHNQALVDKLNANFDSIEINIWGDREVTDFQGNTLAEKQFARKLRVQFTPTLLFLSRDGEVIVRLNGYQSIAKMNAVLDYVLSNSYQVMTFANFKKQSPSAQASIALPLMSASYFDKPPYLLARSSAFPASQYLAVIFSKRDCLSCDKLQRKHIAPASASFKQMQTVILDMASYEPLITPDGNKTTANQWYTDLALTDIPSIVFFDKNGKEIIRMDAFFKTFHFQSVLQYVLTDAYQQEPNFQRFLEHRADALRAQGIDVDIWQ